MQTEEEDETPKVLFCDASTQANDWQSFSHDELQDELAFRLSAPHFALTLHQSVPLIRNYDRREMYKEWGATYNGGAKEWYYPLGVNRRYILQQHPEWLRAPEMLRRNIMLQLTQEVERSPCLRAMRRGTSSSCI